MPNQSGAQMTFPEGHFEIDLFHQREIRKVFHDGEWWFSVSDVVGAITDSVDSAKYLQNMRARDAGLAAAWLEITQPLQIETRGGRQAVNCARVEGIFRIMQSIPSAKAEPFKRWIAKTAYEHVQESENPELAIRRAILNYQLAGRSDEWINARVKTIQSRKELTDEWKQRGIQEPEYPILTGI